jgi:hypothetical protein
MHSQSSQALIQSKQAKFICEQGFPFQINVNSKIYVLLQKLISDYFWGY